MDLQERLDYIGTYDPDSRERLRRLLDRKQFLADGNVYGERFTDRQFELVFSPLVTASYERAQILEALAGGDATVPVLADKLAMDASRIFDHMKELMKRNIVNVAGFDERHPIYRKG
jgi:hypothetical protein